MSIAHRNFARVSVALILVIAVGASLWFASPPPVKALEISITPPASGTFGDTQTFSVNVTMTDPDLVPIQSVNITIYKEDAPDTYKVVLANLSLNNSSRQTHPVTAGSAYVTANTTGGWAYFAGSGYAYWKGYGYSFSPPSVYGYGYAYGGGGSTSITYVIDWTSPPSGWPDGNDYVIEVEINASSTTLTKTFTETSDLFSLTEPTPAPQTTPTLPAGGGEGRAGVTSVLQYLTQAGRFKEDVTCRSGDRKVTLFIPKDTIGKNRVGSLLSSISIKEMTEPPSLPEQCSVIGLVYRLGPDRATFDPPIDLTINYDPSLIPQGVAEERLVVTTFDTFAWGTSQWVELESTVDPEADTIMAKISHFSAVAVLAPTRPANFTVTDLSITPQEIISGESVDVSVIVTNTGDLTGSYEVSLKINDMIVQAEEVTLDGGGSKTVSFSVTSDTIGEYNVDISGLLGTFEVKAPKPPAPATFTTSALTISPAEVNVEEIVTISATVANIGDVTGTYQVTLKIDGVAVQAKNVTLDKGTSLDVIFKTATNIAGTYTVDVDGLRGTFIVREKAPPMPLAPPTPQAPPPPPVPVPAPTPVSGWLIGGIVAAVICIGVVVWVILARRRPGWRKHLAEIEKQIDQLFKQ